MANKTLKDELKRMKVALKQAQKELPRAIGNTVRNRALENFRLESFNNEKWAGRKMKEQGPKRNLLVKTGELRRSLRITRAVWGDVRVGTNVIYAQVHNEGGETHPTVTKKMRKFAWAMYYKNKGSAKASTSSTTDSGTNSASFWRNLALTKKTSLTIKIKKRQYLGAEPELEKRIKQVIEAQFLNVFENGIHVTIRLS